MVRKQMRRALRDASELRDFFVSSSLGIPGTAGVLNGMGSQIAAPSG